MQPRTLLNVLALTQQLKDTTRHCTLPSGRRESVAEHCWQCAVMAILVSPEFPEADMEKVVLMCLLHDLGEMFTGDIFILDKTEQDRETENRLLGSWLKQLDRELPSGITELFRELEEKSTLEYKIFKAIDSMEALIQHNHSPISSWTPEERELNLHYGFDRAGFSPYLLALRREIQKDVESKLKEG